jgi:chorismate mutase
MTARAVLMEPPIVELRARIEEIDAQLIELIAARQAAVREIGHIKREQGKPVLDPEREAQVLRRVAEMAREFSLDEEELRDLWRKLLAMARRVQVGDSSSS